MKEDIVRVRIDPETREALDKLVASQKAKALGTVTQSDVVRHAINELARTELDTQRDAS